MLLVIQFILYLSPPLQNSPSVFIEFLKPFPEFHICYKVLYYRFSRQPVLCLLLYDPSSLNLYIPVRSSHLMYRWFVKANGSNSHVKDSVSGRASSFSRTTIFLPHLKLHSSAVIGLFKVVFQSIKIRT